MKKTQDHPLLEKSPPKDLLFGSDKKESEPITLLLTKDYLVRDINSSGAKAFFKKNKRSIINQSFIDLLLEQHVNTKEFLNAFKLCKSSFVKFITIEHGLLRKKYSVTIIAIPENNYTHYAITMLATNEAYLALKSYVNGIINNLPGAVYWKDREGRYMGCNKFVAEMAGFSSPEDMLGKTDYELCWHEFAEDWRLLDKKVIDEDTTIVREEKAKLANGKIITELTFKTPLKNKDNEIVGIIGTSLDITDRKKVEKELQEAKISAESANNAKSEFLRNMEHQLRTPFSGVYSIVQMLAEAEIDPEKKELLEITYNSAKEFLDLLNDIIDFSRSEAENTAIIAKKFDLRLLIEKTVAMQKAAAVTKGLEIIYNYPADIPTVFISDPNRLRRIVLNLLSNAIRFTDKGYVSIRVKLAKVIDKKQVIIQLIVADTGIGISEEKQLMIYEKFYRVYPANQNKYLGPGLGLYIVKQLISDLEGEIELEIGKR